VLQYNICMTTATDSNKILAFIKTNFPVATFPKIDLSELSKIMVGKILHQIQLAKNSWKINETYRHHTLSMDTAGSGTDFPKGDDFSYILPKIRDTFENLKKIGKTFSFIVGSRIFHIHIIQPIYPNRRINHTKIYAMFDRMIEQIYVWLYVASHFSESKCSPELSIYIYLTDLKKTMAQINDEEPIDKEHANTAFTVACPAERKNEIIIFRKEEWFKVLIHETFHSLGLDFAILPEGPANNAMFSIFPIKCDLRFSETYCESWAEIINVIFMCVDKYCHTDEYRKNSILQMRTLCKMIEEGLHRERIFSLFQCVKILRHYNLRYIDLYDKSSGASSKKRGKYSEKTSVFSYFILKSIILFYYDDFIEWCSTHNRGTIQFKKIQSYVLKFVDFVRQKYNSSDYLDGIEMIEGWFSKNGGENDRFIDGTLRMSVNEYI